VERLHPVTLEQEVPVDVEVAAVVLGNFSTESLHDLVVVEVLGDPVDLVVAEVPVLTRLADVVDVLTGALVRTDHGVITVN